jgi:hypothetical protein
MRFLAGGDGMPEREFHAGCVKILRATAVGFRENAIFAALSQIFHLAPPVLRDFSVIGIDSPCHSDRFGQLSLELNKT